MTTSAPANGHAEVQATFAAILVDEWIRAGLTDAVMCPGSRSTPMAMALADAAEERRLQVHVHHDERSGAFVALGIGLATSRPAMVLTTSGTAAAELHPAVVEADMAGVPLLVCTADRPPELRDVGAPQVIDQVHLFGRSVRWYGELGVPELTGRSRWRAFAARAHAGTVGDRPGPVHLNLAFREPLVGVAGVLPPGRPDGGPWTRLVASAASPTVDLADLAARLAGRRGVFVAGALPGGWGGSGNSEGGSRPRHTPDGVDRLVAATAAAGKRALDGGAIHASAAQLGWPVVAEPRSPAWLPADTLVPHLDAILRSEAASEHLRPEVVVRLGPAGASRNVTDWLAAAGALEVVAGTPGWSDPSATAAVVVDDVAALVAALANAAAATAPPAGWHETWQAAAGAARAAADRELAQGPARAGGPSEPAIARAVVRAVGVGTSLVVSSSMPIRDVEDYAVPRREVRVLANRGANGIDGVVSTAVGVAIGSGSSTALLIGDVAFLHDSNGLLAAAGRGIDLVCVVVDNDGGGIFSFLPQARVLTVDTFETLFGTPHGLDLVAVAAALGVPARRLDPREDVTGAVAEAAAEGGLQVLVVPTDRGANAEAHRRVDDAIAAAVDAALAIPAAMSFAPTPRSGRSTAQAQAGRRTP